MVKPLTKIGENRMDGSTVLECVEVKELCVGNSREKNVSELPMK